MNYSAFARYWSFDSPKITGSAVLPAEDGRRWRPPAGPALRV
jgi:hypothetical protein